MRVALNHVAVGARRGGAETYVGLLARALDAAGHEVHVLAAHVDQGELPAHVHWHPIHADRRPGLGWLWPYRFAQASAGEIARGDFDLVIGFGHVWRQDVCIALNGCRPGLLRSSQYRLRGRLARAFWWLGKWASPRQWVHRCIDDRALRRGNCPLVIAPSERVADDFRRYFDMPSDRLCVIPLGIELAAARTDYAAARASLRAQWRLEPLDVAVMFAAHNYALKGLQPLLQAFSRVARTAPHARLLVCGNARDNSYRRLVRRLGLESQVRFLGFVDDVRACMAAADTFMLPTFGDACSLVVLEAMSAGLPVLTTRSNGAAELISDGRDGFVIPSPWHVNDLAERLERLVVDETLRRRMGTLARARSRGFSIGASVNAMLSRIERELPNTLGSTRRVAA